jgi:hypothetical protein
MSNDGVSDADGLQDERRSFTGECAFVGPVNVLGSDGDIRTFGGFDGGVQIDEGRTDDDLVAVVIGDQGKKGVEEVASLVGSFVHLPVAGD